MRGTKREIKEWKRTEMEPRSRKIEGEGEARSLLPLVYLAALQACSLGTLENRNRFLAPSPPPSPLPLPTVCVFAFECRRHTKRTLYVHSLSFLEGTPFLLLRIFVTLRTRFLSLLSRTRSTYPHLYPLVFLSLCVAKPSFKLVSAVLPSETLCLLRSLHFSWRFLYSPSLSAPFCQKITRNEIAIHFVHKYFGKILWKDKSIIELRWNIIKTFKTWSNSCYFALLVLSKISVNYICYISSTRWIKITEHF